MRVSWRRFLLACAKREVEKEVDDEGCWVGHASFWVEVVGNSAYQEDAEHLEERPDEENDSGAATTYTYLEAKINIEKPIDNEAGDGQDDGDTPDPPGQSHEHGFNANHLVEEGVCPGIAREWRANHLKKSDQSSKNIHADLQWMCIVEYRGICRWILAVTTGFVNEYRLSVLLFLCVYFVF